MKVRASWIRASFVLAGSGAFALASAPAGQVGEVKSEQKISETAGGFGGTLAPNDFFGSAVAALGDLDRDGNVDIAVGAPLDDTGAADQGAVWILFLNADGTVRASRKIAQGTGGFGGPLASGDSFGWAVVSPGDLDGDGVLDLAVGTYGGEAVWILFLNADGTVKSERKIGSAAQTYFGASVAALGDLDHDGVADLAVGAPSTSDGDFGAGGIWILFLRADGRVKTLQKISQTDGGLGDVLDPYDQFGISCASLGDLDGDGVADLAVGAYLDDDGGTDAGAAWILFLNADGTVRAEQKISGTSGSFGGLLDPIDFFGCALASPGDLDGDGRADLAVGAYGDDDGSSGQGAAWLCFLRGDGTVKREHKLSATAGGFGGNLDLNDAFGRSLAFPGDLDGDGTPELCAGAPDDDDGGTDQGAVWTLFLEGPRDPYGPATPIPPGAGVGRVGPRLFVVDDTPAPCVFSQSIQEAVNTASDGDVIYVKQGSYTAVTIANKSVHLIGEPGPSGVALSGLTVRDLRADRPVVVRGFGGPFRMGIDLHDDAGAVWLEGCRLSTSTITNCAQVGLSDSSLEGFRTISGFCPAGGSALIVTSSTLFAYDTAFTGTGGCGASINDIYCDSYICIPNDATPGANALELRTASAYLFGCTVQGGDGGDGVVYTGTCSFCPGSLPGAPGGYGLLLPSGSSAVWLDTTILGGSGQPGILGPGTRTLLPGNTCAFSVTAPLVQGSLASLTFAGPPGDSVFLTYSAAFAPQYVPERSGYSVVDPASTTIFLGTLPGSGVLQTTLPIDLLAGRQQAAVLFTQAKLYDPVTDKATLGAPSVLLELRRSCP